ncbi:MAG: ribonuclease E/G, partial [Ilumatobacteraceae bacterium]
ADLPAAEISVLGGTTSERITLLVTDIVRTSADSESIAQSDEVGEAFRSALSRDKTRTQVFDISELGLVEMTRKRIGEGLLTSFAGQCPDCQGRGVLVDHDLLH